jgi:hypothetical protein
MIFRPSTGGNSQNTGNFDGEIRIDREDNSPPGPTNP